MPIDCFAVKHVLQELVWLRSQFSLGSALLPIPRYCPNNVGDPFHDSNFEGYTHEMEREVIVIFADLMCLPRDQARG